MTNRLPVISGRQAVKVFKKFGYVQLPRRGKGSHMILVHEKSGVILTVPDHKELDRGTLRALIRDAGISRTQFQKAAR